MMHMKDGISVGGRTVNSFRFADDKAIVSDNEEGLQRLMDSLVTAGERFEMRINITKTKVMKVARSEGTYMNMNITISAKKVDQVKQFTYFVCVISNDAYNTSEIKTRIALAKKAFSKHSSILTPNNLKQSLRKRLVKYLVCFTSI